MAHKDPIGNSNLPAEIQELIRTVIKRSRLWKSERHALTLELTSHFADGLEAGNPAEELIKKFGDAKVAAKLMRRAKKRNRPVWWRAGRRMLQAAGVFVLVYIGLALLLSMRHPDPRVDYLALLNASATKAPEADRAWPIYRKAWADADLAHFNDSDLDRKDAEGKPMSQWANPGDPEWPTAVAFLDRHAALLSALREAGAKPSLGFIVGRQEDFSDEDRAALGLTKGSSEQFWTGRRDDGRASTLMSGSLMTVLLPQLALMRKSANLLSCDMIRAASEGDDGRVVSDYQSVLGMAMQAREQPMLVNEVVSLGITALADKTLLEVQRKYPETLAEHRVELLHRMSSAKALFAMDMSGERMFFDDMIQRVYSDNGRGDGTITADGISMMSMIWSINQPGTNTRASFLSQPAAAISLPLAVCFTGSRKDLQEAADLFYATADRDARRPLWVKLHQRSEAEQLLMQWKRSPMKNVHLMLLTVLAPAVQRASETFDMSGALHESAMAVFALETYKTKQGHYPAALGELVPHYLPSVPVDYSTGEPLRYKLVDGKPVLYGLGKDGVDDGGVWMDKKIQWPKLPDTGDWVLYPSPKDEN